MENSHSKKVVMWVLVVVVVIAAVLAYVVFQQRSITTDQFTDSLKNAEDTFNAGDINLSIAELEALLSKDLTSESRFDVLVALASAYAQKGSLEFKEIEYGTNAITILNQALEINSQNSNAYRVMGYAYEIMQNYPKAVENYETAIELNQNNAMAYSGLGHAYDLMGDTTKAEFNLKEAVRLDPTLDHALYNLAKINFAQQKFDDAETYANAVLKVSNNNRFFSEATSLLGLLKMREMKYREAVVLFEDALSKDDQLVHNYVFLADAKIFDFSSGGNIVDISNYEQKEATLFAETTGLIEKALAINPNYASTYLVKAKILGLSGKTTEVIPTLQQGLAVVERDITLGALEKESMKQRFAETITNYSQQL